MIKKLIRKLLQKNLRKGKSKLNILDTFPEFEARGWGGYSQRANDTIKCINQIIPALSNLTPMLSESNKKFKKKIEGVFLKEEPYQAELSRLFSKYGSDKSTIHNYHLLYAYIIRELGDVKNIFELGLRQGCPSLKAFRDYAKTANIYGADIDHKMLLQMDNIKTFYVDQTSISEMSSLGNKLKNNFDLMIDDGLHSLNANLNTLQIFMNLIKVGGYIVIEDIYTTNKIWKTVSKVLEDKFVSAFVETQTASIFVLKRIK